MRFRFLLLFPGLLLAACAKTDAPVRLDFIGTTTLTSGNRTVGVNDTLITRAYAVGNDNLLKRLRITVTYEPGPQPIIYPVPLSSYEPENNDPPSQTITYLDSLVTPITSTSAYRGGELLFENRFSARSTSGTEVWRYTVTDETGESASRAYRLTARKTDSAAVFHSYTARLRPVPSNQPSVAQVRDRARVFLNLRLGLLLPKYAVINNENSLSENQGLIDLIGVAGNNTVSLNAPVGATLNANWLPANRRATQLRRTTLTLENFNSAATTAAFNEAFNNGTRFTNEFSTGSLAKNQVIAFKAVGEGAEYTGLLLVSDLVLGTSPVLTCSVKVQK
ncbi:hypothetical protein [Hymenobacter terrenus]|uniref:hypothetical protein n=1 Tax=Hymenobacter terrenus TaxID=1629124 RepID=UPI0006190D45|nr:hypothetical protein [Hymenobacter terrenus]